MRLLSFVLNLLELLQHLVSIWFLYDFFLVRDSVTLSSLNHSTSQNLKLNDDLTQLVARLTDRYCPKGELEEPIFDKLIFIVIDALGSEFMTNLDASPISDQGMSFTESLVARDLAESYVAVATSPTVTMPRIKALLSGTIPSFSDIMFNLASDVSRFEDENLLQLARAKNRSIVFYGDDTWLSLFDKSLFTRHKETFSFFASDYTSVDTNVTELAIPETKMDPIDWDLLILHYLGLDHIGHVFGSNKDPLIKVKLEEMDSVVKDIYDNMSRKNHKTLIVVVGDHGMSRTGNHGGDTDLETRTAAVFIPINKKFRTNSEPTKPKEKVLQIDIAATLSLLIGLSPPKASKGVAIESILERLMTDQELYCRSLENLLQLTRLMAGDVDLLQSTQTSVKELLSRNLEPGNISDLNLMSSSYRAKSRDIQKLLLQRVASEGGSLMLVFALCFVILFTLVRIRKASIRLLLQTLPKQERYACLLAMTIPILMHGSTDFIESEHLLWPPYSLLVATLFIGLVVIQLRGPILDNIDTLKASLMIITFIITYSWNNLNLTEVLGDNGLILFFALSLLCNFARQNSDLPKFRGQLAIFVGFFILMVGHEDHFGPIHGISRANIECLALFVVSVYTLANIATSDVLKDKEFPVYCSKLAVGWMMVAFLVARRHNYFLLSANIIMEISVNNLCNSLKLSPISRVIMYTFFAQSAFYNQGNTNLFSSIDVRASVYGRDSYNLYFAIIMVSVATYSSQIYWIVKMFQRTQSDKCIEAYLSSSIQTSKSKVESSIADTSVSGLIDFLRDYNFLSLSYYMFVCLVLRNHLFIWSVISPKLVFHYMTNLIVLISTASISLSYKLIKRSPLMANYGTDRSPLLKDTIL